MQNEKSVEEGKEIISTPAELTTWASHTPEVRERIQMVAQELLGGARQSQICQMFCEEWDLSPSTVINIYIKAARELIKHEFPVDSEELREELLAKYRHLYWVNMQSGDLKEARAVLDSVTKLTQGINTQINVLGQIQTINLVEVKNEES